MKSFRQLYCERMAIPPDRFEHRVFLDVLYPHARSVRWLLGGVHGPRYFQADLDFIRSLGTLRSRRGFADEAHEFVHHSGNRNFLRHRLKLRVSVARMRALFEATVDAADSRPPALRDETRSAGAPGLGES